MYPSKKCEQFKLLNSQQNTWQMDTARITLRQTMPKKKVLLSPHKVYPFNQGAIYSPGGYEMRYTSHKENDFELVPQ